MWTNTIVNTAAHAIASATELCDDKYTAIPTPAYAVRDDEARRNAVIQLLSIISIVVQSAGGAYRRSDEEGERVVKTVCELSRQALAELRTWSVESAAPSAASATSRGVNNRNCDPARAFRADDRLPIASATRTATMSAPSTLLPRRTASQANPHDLTPREMELLRLIVRGLSNKEIAHTLHLTEGTVKGYVSHLLSKMNVRSRTRAATAALEQGWV